MHRYLTLAALLAGACGGPAKPNPDGGVMTDRGWKSGTRLRAVIASAGSGRLFVRWHDGQLGLDCNFQYASDGQIRCLPEIAGVTTMFEDAQCKNAVGAYATGIPTPKLLPPTVAPFVCGKSGDYYSVGAALTPTNLYRFDDSGNCVVAPVSAGSSYVRGSVLAPASFVSAVEHADARGPRLSLRQFVADDGARQDLQAIDGARAGALCTPNPDSATAAHCTPFDLAYVEGFFSDSACSVKAAFRPGYAQDQCARPPSAIQGDMFYEVGARITTTIYDAEGGQCAVYTPAPSLFASFYALGAPLPLSSLPSLTLTNEGSDRVRVQVARTPTGDLVQALGFFDSAKNTTCIAGLAADGQERCIPSAQLSIHLFSDPQCTQGLFSVDSGAPPPTAGAFASAGVMRGDAEATAIFQIGAKIATPPMVWQVSGATCQPFAPSASDFYAAAPVAPADFVAVVTAPE